MCFSLWQSNLKYNQPPVGCKVLYTGAAATLSVLLGKSIEEVKQAFFSGSSSRISKVLYGPATCTSFLQVFPILSRKEFKNLFISKFNQQLKQTASHKQANLQMQMPVAWSDKYKPNPGQQVVQGHVVVLKCWLDLEDGKVVFVLTDYRDDLSGKQIRLPREDEVNGYWSFNPMFYQK